MATCDTTSNADLYDYLVKQGMPDQYKEMNPQEAIQALGKKLIVREMTAKGKVYFITDGHYVKIGHTYKSMKSRINSLQTGNARLLRVIGTIENVHQNTERELHHKYQKQHQLNEWFRIEGELLQYLIDTFEFRSGRG